MVESLTRPSRLNPSLRVLPGDGDAITIDRDRAWLDLVARERWVLA